MGCCGFGSSRKKYYENFEIVEIQQTFYNPPRISTLNQWRIEAPDSFEFSLKAWQLITHEPSSPTYRRLKSLKIPESKKKFYGFFKPTDEVYRAWQTVKQCALILKSTFIVFQTPSSFKPDKENINNLKKFFTTIDRENLTLGWEPRGNWNKEEIKNICKELNLIHIVDPFQNDEVWGDIIYFRLHGIRGYKYKYTGRDLAKLKTKVQGKKGYVMFNNVYMNEDALRFKDVLMH